MQNRLTAIDYESDSMKPKVPISGKPEIGGLGRNDGDMIQTLETLDY